MILDLERFTAAGQPLWRELEDLLERIEARPDRRMELAEAERLEDLYHQAAADLNRVEHGAAAPALAAYLERLVARAYGEIYAAPRQPGFAPRRWRAAARGARRFFGHLPRVFRRHVRLFWLALALTLAGVAFGALAVRFDPAATDVLLPAEYLRNPAARVAEELGGNGRHQPDASQETAFSAQLITHNIQVSLFALALGVTLGLGTGLLLVTNGIMLGAVAARYGQQGFGWFVAGWLLPHGAFEIPSVLIAGQAGFLLARLLLQGGREPRRERLRRELPDLLTLFGGLCCLLAWAGIMEAFFSQHHAPGAGYEVQVMVGCSELVLLGGYLALAGRKPEGGA